MFDFDASQLQVLQLDPGRHARVLGAPGSGKTMLATEMWAELTERKGWDDAQLTMLAPNRRVATQLRRQLERRLARAIGGTPVRTAASLAFALLQRHAALQGLPAPRLLTGTAQDETVEAVLNDVIAGRLSLQQPLPFLPDVLVSDAFRGELRDLDRVLDDYGVSAEEVLARLAAAARSSHAPGPVAENSIDAEALARWGGALELTDVVRARLLADRPTEFTSSAMLRAASALVRQSNEIELPKLVLADDAGELGEGALALLTALAERGVSVWVFGDPDTATSAFQGERTRVLAGLEREFLRRGHQRRDGQTEQLVVLDRTYRHGAEIRGLVQQLSGRIGAAGAGQQRRAHSIHDSTTHLAADRSSVEFASVSTPSEQIGVIAHRLRARHLGLDGQTALPWSHMAIICRTRGEVTRVARALAGLQVPSTVAAGGLVLREHQLVRELIRLLQHSMGLARLTAADVVSLLGGVIGGLDPIALRRLRGALRLRAVREGDTAERGTIQIDDVILESFEFVGDRPVLDMRPARQLMKLGKLAAAAESVHRAAGTPREVLWQIWQGSGLASSLQDQALHSRGQRSEEAHLALDAVLGLFFALQRHEEQDSERPIGAVLDDLLVSTVPEDSLAARSQRDVVTVTTPQGVIGNEFALVCVLGPQDGEWPNLRARGSLLGVTTLERWLRDGLVAAPSRQETLHDELRLFVHAIARAKTEVLVVAVKSEDVHPSVFFALGRTHLIEESLPSTRLTLRGAVAEMRRRLVQDPADAEALNSLIALADAGVPAAHPDEWYGVRDLSTNRPLVDIDSGEMVRVSPSQMEKAETCPLDWFVSRIGGFSGDYRVNIGTLLHRALETAEEGATAEELRDSVFAHWSELRFEAGWQSDRARQETEDMSAALARYLADFARSGHELVAREATFEVPLEYALIRGAADRIEARRLDDGTLEMTVVDLKTGRNVPSKKDIAQHAQLQAYQFGVTQGAFVTEHGDLVPGSSESTAKLVHVHPESLSKTQRERGEQYLESVQPQLTEPQQAELIERVLSVAQIMAQGTFTAQVEHHCTNQFAPSKACALHIIPAVSHA